MDDVDPSVLRSEAERLWKYLDELSSRDPDAYTRFLSKQADEARQQRQEEAGLFLPEAVLCVETNLVSHPEIIKRSDQPGTEFQCFINIARSAAVPPALTRTSQLPASAKEPLENLLIPLSVGPLRKEKDSSTRAFCVRYYSWPYFPVVLRVYLFCGGLLFFSPLSLRSLPRAPSLSLLSLCSLYLILFINFSIYTYLSFSIYLFTYVSAYLSTYLSIYLSIHLPNYYYLLLFCLLFSLLSSSLFLSHGFSQINRRLLCV